MADIRGAIERELYLRVGDERHTDLEGSKASDSEKGIPLRLRSIRLKVEEIQSEGDTSLLSFVINDPRRGSDYLLQNKPNKNCRILNSQAKTARYSFTTQQTEDFLQNFTITTCT